LLGNDAGGANDLDGVRREGNLRLMRQPRWAGARAVDERLRIASRRERFVDATFQTASAALDYRLYPPAEPAGRDGSLVVMLHGAGQDHVDFARGTRMHEHPDAADAFVVYPGQRDDVRGRCWNWFRSADQSRGRGEPATLAALTRRIVAEHDISPRRVYVAGLSAGAAMAIVLAQAYPDLYAAVGVHSGLPYRSASDVYAAFDVMARGPSQLASSRRGRAAVPTIVFHADGDNIVHANNAGAIVADALDCCAEHAPTQSVSATRVRGRAVHRHTTTVFRDAKGRSCVEQWIVHAGGHAWSGGSPEGSHTDPAGPDATGEMLRFFRLHRLEPRAAR